jgi:hypothetical protein
MTPAMHSCERCGGSGRTPRLQRRRADGSLDPADIVGRHHQICERCGGSGETPADGLASVGGRRGYVADLL